MLLVSKRQLVEHCRCGKSNRASAGRNTRCNDDETKDEECHRRWLGNDARRTVARGCKVGKVDELQKVLDERIGNAAAILASRLFSLGLSNLFPPAVLPLELTLPRF